MISSKYKVVPHHIYQGVVAGDATKKIIMTTIQRRSGI